MAGDVNFTISADDEASRKIDAIRNQLTGMKNDVNKLVESEKVHTSTMDSMKLSIIAVNQAMQVAKQVYATVKQVIDETVGSYIKYANEVRTLQQLNGTTAEQTSRLIQLTDDHKISTDALTMATRKLATEGLSLTVESLAKLSNEYRALGSSAEKTKFLIDNFGRSGTQFAEIMEMGADAINRESEAINKNLILTEEALKLARDYEKAQDELKDTQDALAIAVGMRLTPALIELTKTLTNLLELDWRTWLKTLMTIQSTLAGLGGLFGVITGWIIDEDEALEANLDTLENYNPELEKFNGQLESTARLMKADAEATKYYAQQLSDITSFASRYRTGIENITTAENNLKVAEQDLAALRKAGWGEGTDAIKTAKQRVNDLTGAMIDAKIAARDATNEMIAGFLQASLAADGVFDEPDMQKVLDYRLAMGLLTQEEYNAAQQAIEIANNIAGIKDKTVHINIEWTGINWPELGGKGGRSGEQEGGGATGGRYRGWTLVGDTERGATQYSELVYAPGGMQVIDRHTTASILQARGGWGGKRAYAPEGPGWIPPSPKEYPPTPKEGEPSAPGAPRSPTEKAADEVFEAARVISGSNRNMAQLTAQQILEEKASSQEQVQLLKQIRDKLDFVALDHQKMRQMAQILGAEISTVLS